MTVGEKPPRKTGVAHFFAAAGYSMAGAQRLWRESSFRQEVVALGVLVLVFLAFDVTAVEMLGLLLLGLLVLLVEALNTALEEVVDHLSPGWSAFAKNAKDMGSFAVACALAATGLYAGWVLIF